MAALRAAACDRTHSLREESSHIPLLQPKRLTPAKGVSFLPNPALGTSCTQTHLPYSFDSFLPYSSSPNAISPLYPVINKISQSVFF